MQIFPTHRTSDTQSPMIETARPTIPVVARSIATSSDERRAMP